MTMYRVVYEIDIESDTPTNAAREAWGCMVDSESAPPTFDVIPLVGNVIDTSQRTTIDLEEV